MTRFDDLDRGLAAYFDGETIAPAPDALLESVIRTTAGRRQQPRWLATLTGDSAPATPRPLADSQARWLFAVVLLVVAATIALAVGAGGLLNRTSTVPTPPPTAGPLSSASPEPSSLGFSLDGTWTAVKPANFAFGEPSGEHLMTLSLGPRSTFQSSIKIGWLTAQVSADTDSLTFRTADGSGPDDSGVVDEAGNELAPCAAGSAGRYQWGLGARGDWMTFVSLGDACAARSAVLENRVWSRRTSVTAGATLTLDAFTPTMTLTLPDGEYQTTRTTASWSATSVLGVIEVATWLDPQGMRDACDARAGTADMAPGQEGFVAFLRSRPDFTVLSTAARTIDGHPATAIELQVNAVASCALGRSVAWQGASETSGQVATISSGDRVHLAVVEVGSAVVLFQVRVDDSSGFDDPAAVAAILDSVRFGP